MQTKVKKTKQDLSFPLDYLDPEEFGEMDDSEIELICKYNALDLVLIENAAELFRKAFQSGDIFETVLDTLVRSQNDNQLDYFSSETFPFFVTEEFKNKFYKDYDTSDEKDKYYNLVKNYRKDIDRRKKYISIVAVDLEELGGHYAAFYYENNTVNLFDSMQTELSAKEKKIYEKIQTIGSASFYTPFFYQLLSDVFPGAQIVIPDCIKNELSLQYTGGFPYSDPYYLELTKKRLNVKTRELLKIQSTESQNHFCYLWAIWWLQLKLLNMNLRDILPIFKNNDPLITIKKYAWGMTQLFELKISYRDFFNKHFMSIWSNINGSNQLSLDFHRYDIKTPASYKDIHDVFSESIQNLKLILVSNTPVPGELCF